MTLPAGSPFRSRYAEKPFDGRENPSGIRFYTRGSFSTRSEAHSPFGDDMAEGLDQIRIGFKEMLHCGVSDFQHLSLLRGDDVRRARLSRKEGHFTEEV